MVETQLVLDGMTATRSRVPMRARQLHECAACQKPVWRTPSQLGKRAFCSPQCYDTMRVAMAGQANQAWRGGKVKLSCAECGADVLRFKSQVKSRVFCGKECADRHGLVDVACWWPKCGKALSARVISSGRGKEGYAVYKTNLTSRGYYVRYPLCQKHVDHAIAVMGPATRFNSIWKILAQPEQPRASRGISRTMRFVIWTLADGACEMCRQTLEFESKWQIDHRVPVQDGGKTVISNLRPLCIPCHNVKSAPEKARSAERRHAGKKIGRWLTHHEKDERTARLEQDVDELKKAVLMLFMLLSSRRHG